MPKPPSDTLRSCLSYEPRPLSFGTSGRRGEVVHLTQLEIYINVLAELEYLQLLPASEGGIQPGDEFYFAYDLRPSSTSFVPEEQGRGELAQAVQLAIKDAGMVPVNLGRIPTPALTFHALSNGKGSIMVTGSHIPFNRNGYKLNTSRGELLKTHESAINLAVQDVRDRLYSQPNGESLFDEQGMLKAGTQNLATEKFEAAKTYLERYTSFFEEGALGGRRIVLYQHSAVGRDLVVELLSNLGAEVIVKGRSETFVPIDTENIDAAQLEVIQKMTDEVRHEHGKVDAVVSTDGDSDRPLILGVDKGGAVRFFPGDLVGILVAEYLGADAVVVPISCNDAIDRGKLASLLEPKTKIGSPYIIGGMEKALLKGHHAVCGWEANGGFLVGSDIRQGDAVLASLPTRDAVLPILCVLVAAKQQGLTLTELFGALPKRFSRARLIRPFAREDALRITHRFTPEDPEICEVEFAGGKVKLMDIEMAEMPVNVGNAQACQEIRTDLGRYFSKEIGFSDIEKINYTDGVRVYFANGDIAHLRPSGNADELRIYAVADSQERADEISELGVAEPDGILLRMRAGS